MTVIPGDPFGVQRSDQNDTTPPAQQVNLFHKNADTDSSIEAAHHTCGSRRNQASPGDHIHDGKNCRKIGEGQNITLTGAKGGNAALANLITMLQEWIDFTDTTT